jgi:hypothetical protein
MVAGSMDHVIPYVIIGISIPAQIAALLCNYDLPPFLATKLKSTSLELTHNNETPAEAN